MLSRHNAIQFTKINKIFLTCFPLDFLANACSKYFRYFHHEKSFFLISKNKSDTVIFTHAAMKVSLSTTTAKLLLLSFLQQQHHTASNQCGKDEGLFFPPVCLLIQHVRMQFYLFPTARNPPNTFTVTMRWFCVFTSNMPSSIIVCT